MDYPALNKLFLDAVDRYANPKAQIYKTANGWESISAGEMLRRVAGLSKALGELGIKAGDRVGIFAPNCAEWHVADFAITGTGRGQRADLFQRVRRPADVHPERFGRADRDHQGRSASAQDCRSARTHARCSNT